MGSAAYDKQFALVTGGGNGIGKEICRKLAEAGYGVGINCMHSIEAANGVAEDIRAMGGEAEVLPGDIGCDAGRREVFAMFAEKFPRLDLLVNNAGITICRSFLDVDEDLVDKLFTLDFKGAFFMTQLAAKSMIAAGTKGCVINISSLQQEIQYPEACVYGPVKAALSKFALHAALELSPYGIRVNTIAPGWIYTGDPNRRSARTRFVEARIPLNRPGNSADIADAVVYLASKKAGYITGANLKIDGGLSLPCAGDNLYYSDRVQPDKMG